MTTRDVPLDAEGTTTGIARRDVLLAATLVAGAGAGLMLRPGRAEAVPWGTLERVVPKAIGAYRVSDQNALTVPLTDPILTRTYTDLLTRLYVAPGQPSIMLLIALGDGGSAGLAVHRPEECYPAAGFTLSNARPLPIGGLSRAGATIVTAKRGEWTEQIYFWVRIGAMFPASPWEQRLATMRHDLSGQRAGGALVRLALVSADRGGAADALVAFNAALLASLPPSGRSLVGGMA